MAGQINISGATDAVQLHGNDDYTQARDFTFPDESGELLIKTANDDVPGIGSINGGPLAGMRNAIINGNFTITQRGGQSVTTGEAKYCIDRWELFSSQAGQAGSGAQSGEGIDVHSKSLGITLSGGATRGLEVVQGIELETSGAMAPFKTNAEYTVSYWAKTTVADFAKVSRARFGSNVDGSGGVTNVTVTEVTGHTGGGGWEKLEYRLTMPASISAGQIALYLYLGSFNAMAGGSSVKFAGVQLEPGPVATPFEHRPIGLEKQLCSRYFQTSYQHGTAPGTANRRVGCLAYRHSLNSTFACFPGQFREEMRAIPTLTIYNPDTGTANNFRNDSAGTNINVNDIQNTGTCGFSYVEGTIPLVDGSAYLAHYTADAEL